MSDHVVVAKDELDEGGRVIAQIEGREICVFKVDGDYYAYTNWCAHQAGPVCEGKITGTTDACFDEDILETRLSYIKENQILNCPWHGWEYDITTGECLSRNGIKLPEYQVNVKEDNVVVSL